MNDAPDDATDPPHRLAAQVGRLTRRDALAGLGLALPWFGRAAAQGAAPHRVAVTIASDHDGLPTNPRLLGTNTPWPYGSDHLMEGDGHWNDAVVARAREWSPSLLRYPCLPDTHHWRQGMGPLADRPPVPAYDDNSRQKIVFGTQEFLEACEIFQAEPLIQVNVHQGDTPTLARQAADWVGALKARSMRSRATGRPLAAGRLWELGNEPYVMDKRLPDGRPNPLFLRPDAYGRRVGAVLAAMRAVDPTLRAGLPFALDTYSGGPWKPDGEPASVVGDQLGFADKVLGALPRPQDIGFLSLHYYMPLVYTPFEIDDATRLPDDEVLYWGAMGGTQTLRGHLDMVHAFWRKHPATAQIPVPPFIVTEYNSFFTNARRHGKEVPQNAYVMTLAGAMFVADLLLVLATRPEVEAALQWSLTGNWVFGAIAPDAAAHPRPVFELMLLMRRLLEGGGRLLDTRIDVETTSRASRRVGFATSVARLPLASVLATRHGRQLRVLVINKDPARDAAVELDLGAVAARQAHVDSLSAETLFAAPDTARAAVPGQSTPVLSPDGRKVNATLAPASLALWTIDLRT